jgi:hypothetical protein
MIGAQTTDSGRRGFQVDIVGHTVTASNPRFVQKNGAADFRIGGPSNPEENPTTPEKCSRTTVTEEKARSDEQERAWFAT